MGVKLQFMILRKNSFCSWHLGQMSMSPALPHSSRHVQSGEEKYSCMSLSPQSGHVLDERHTFSGLFIMLAKTSSHGKNTSSGFSEFLSSSMSVSICFISIIMMFLFSDFFQHEFPRIGHKFFNEMDINYWTFPLFLSRILELKNQRSTYEVEVNFLYYGIYMNLRWNGKPFPAFPFWCMENSRRLRRIILVNSFIDYKF